MTEELAITTASLKLRNAASVLSYAWQVPVFTASDAIAATGLTRSTVISLCDELVARGWLTELPDARSAGDAYRKGRPARRYALRTDAGLIVGVDAGQNTITASVADLGGVELGRASARIEPEASSGKQRLAVTDATVADALARAGAVPADILCLVVGVPAPTDDEGDSPGDEDVFWLRMNPGFARHFRARGLTTIVENDANLAAVAEGTSGAGAGVSSFITLVSGERFGAGYIVDDHLVRGARGGAGEMHLLAYVEGVGSPEGIGALLRSWARKGREDGTVGRASSLASIPLPELDARHVLAAADDGDEAALDILDRLAERLARICAVLDGLLDVERIVFSGAVAASLGLLLEKTRARLADISHPKPPELAASGLGAAVVTLGAVTRGLAWVRHNVMSLAAEPSPRPPTAAREDTAHDRQHAG
jgi:predicted NBD/HSP70 family sugar kinase